MSLFKSNTVSATMEQHSPSKANKRRIASPSRHEEFPAVIKKRRHSAGLPDYRAGGQDHGGMAALSRKRPAAAAALHESCPCPAKRPNIPSLSTQRYSSEHTSKRKRQADPAGDAANVTTSGSKRRRFAAARVVTEPSPCPAKRQRTQTGAAVPASSAPAAAEHSQSASGEVGSSSLPFVTDTTHHTPSHRSEAPSAACLSNKTKLSKDEEEAVRIFRICSVPMLSTGDVESIESNGIKRLGSGAYGSCNKAVDPITQQPLVIKKFANNRNGLNDLIVEATNLQYLQLPGVQRLVGVCVQTRQMISHFAGMTANRYFKRVAPSLADTLSVFCQVSRTLQQMIDKGVTHNDLKGDNVCVEVDTDVPQATIIDLGLARQAGTLLIYSKCSDLTLFPWLAPELLRHTHPCGEASDVYSLAYLLKQSLPVRSRPGQRPSLAALRQLMRRAKLVTPGKRPRLSAFTELLQNMHVEATKGAKERSVESVSETHSSDNTKE